MNQSINQLQGRLDLQGGFLIASTAGAACLLRRFPEADDDVVVVVESEVNQTPMERNRDLKEEEEEERKRESAIKLTDKVPPAKRSRPCEWPTTCSLCPVH